MSGEGPQLIKESLSFAAFVGRYTKLQRRGGRLAACCPIHKEKTPSFYLDEAKGFFHCFGCGRGGDLIRFCMEVEGLEFLDALEYLAEVAGVELPKRGQVGPGRETVEKIREVNEAATAYFQSQLARNDAAKEYLRKRGITDGTVRLFRLGLATAQWDGLYTHLLQKFDAKLLASSGLFKEGRTDKPYDLFRNRIIFPIRDVYGHTVAFGGRLFTEEEGPKYINSPETPLYVKGKHVYNLDFAKAFLKKKPEAGVLVVEGYMDVIQLYQAGVCNVIAGLGTAFTPDQGKLLKRFAKRIVLNYDGDAAGFKAARAAIEVFLPLDLELGVVTLPDKLDPDDFIRKHGVAAFNQKLVQAEDFLDYLVRYLSDGKSLDQNPHMRSQVAHELVEIIDKIPDPVIHDHYMNRTSTALSLSLAVLEQLHKPAPKTVPPPRPARPPRGADRPEGGRSARPSAPPAEAPASLPPSTTDEHAPISYAPSDDFAPQSYAPESEPAPFSYGPSPSDELMPPTYGPEAEAGAPPPARSRPPEPSPRDRSRRNWWSGPLTKIEQEFLFHVMHSDNFIDSVAERHREILPKILANVFADRRWVLDFIYDKESTSIVERLEAVPDEFRNTLAAVHFSEEFNEEDSARLDQLCPDLLRAMLERLAELNHQRMRALPPSEEERKKALMRQNLEYRRQAARL